MIDKGRDSVSEDLRGKAADVMTGIEEQGGFLTDVTPQGSSSPVECGESEETDPSEADEAH